MQITDTIADMLTRIRNASSAKHDSVDVPASNVKKAIAQILLDEGYISSYTVIEDGKQGVIMSKAFMDGITAQPYGGAARGSTELIEIEQYWNGQWLNMVGLNANYNMKREAVMSGEAELNDDALLPLVDEMLYWREQGLKDVEEMFGLVASVSLSSAWGQRAEANDLYEDKQEAETEIAEAEADKAEAVTEAAEEQPEETDTSDKTDTPEETEESEETDGEDNE